MTVSDVHPSPLAAQSGEALLPRLYLDPEVLEAEQRLIFERTWQLAGHVSSLPRPGSYMTASAGDQPVLVLRDEHGELRAYRNVCRHRASRLLSGEGQCKGAIRCRYHGWTYRFDGTLIGVPEGMTFGERLDKSKLGLFPVAIEEFCGLIFVNLDLDAPPLARQVEGLAERLAPYRIETLQPIPDSSEAHNPLARLFRARPSDPESDGGQPANWKVVAENYMEGYHVPIAHPGLMRMYDYKRYEAEVHDNWVWFDAPLREKPSSNRLERLYMQLAEPMPGLSEADRRIWRYVFIYPNTTIDLYPDQIGTWQILPDGVGRTQDVFGSFRPANASPRTRFVQWANQRLNTLVLDEDVDLVRNVQAGAHTRDYVCGPLSRREAAVAWFADRIRADLDLDD
ncbi:MAG TPA: aromatic ring-hydroxylating dioxygenase subunit alpha [Solirubrobacteraceae bacterium]|jgi:Rieske 2Fe-2S family protein|nr:aromatic ring-hydroxylating dioxygenase subunit alpha [Solirubrobacteraceae bacterium]